MHWRDQKKIELKNVNVKIIDQATIHSDLSEKASIRNYSQYQTFKCTIIQKPKENIKIIYYFWRLII